MTRDDKITLLIFGAAAAFAVYKFINLPDEEREEFFEHIKDRTAELLDDPDNTVNRVNGFMGELESKGENAWVDRLCVFQKMFKELYKS